MILMHKKLTDNSHVNFDLKNIEVINYWIKQRRSLFHFDIILKQIYRKIATAVQRIPVWSLMLLRAHNPLLPWHNFLCSLDPRPVQWKPIRLFLPSLTLSLSFFEHFLSFWHQKMFLTHLKTSCSSPGTGPFSLEPWLFLLEKSIQKPRFNQVCSLPLGSHYFWAQEGRPRACVYGNACMYDIYTYMLHTHT